VHEDLGGHRRPTTSRLATLACDLRARARSSTEPSEARRPHRRDGIGEAVDLARVLTCSRLACASEGCVVADNADACPAYVAAVRDAGGGFQSVPFADDVELSIKR
jgi:hypothetical protein